MASVYRRSWRGRDGKPRVRWVAQYRGQDGARHNKGFLAKKDAKAFLVLVEGEIARGVHTPESASITVAAAAELWLKRARLDGLERSTLRQYQTHAEQHIIPLIGGVKLARLSTPVVQTFRDRLLEDRSRALAGKILSSLKSILSEAQRRGLVAQNVALPVKLGAKGRERKKLEIGRDVPSRAEVAALLDHAAGRWRAFFVTAIFTGMRASELRGLPWSAVDFEKRTVTVRQRADLWGAIGRPKSAAGEREIPLAPMVYNTLREWKLACPKGPLGLVFPTAAGQVERHQNIAARGFAPLQKKALGRVKYGLHALRHFAASAWIELGFSPKRLQALLGHSSVTMTFDVYGHLFPSAEDDHQKFAEGERQIAAARSVAAPAPYNPAGKFGWGEGDIEIITPGTGEPLISEAELQRILAENATAEPSDPDRLGWTEGQLSRVMPDGSLVRIGKIPADARKWLEENGLPVADD